VKPSSSRRQSEAAIVGAMIKFNWCVDEVSGLSEVYHLSDLCCRVVYQARRQ
jgi:hypothetical protein